MKSSWRQSLVAGSHQIGTRYTLHHFVRMQGPRVRSSSSPPAVVFHFHRGIGCDLLHFRLSCTYGKPGATTLYISRRLSSHPYSTPPVLQQNIYHSLLFANKCMDRLGIHIDTYLDGPFSILLTHHVDYHRTSPLSYRII